MTIKTSEDFNKLTSDKQEDLFSKWTESFIIRILKTAKEGDIILSLSEENGWNGITPPPHPQGWEWDSTNSVWIDPNPTEETDPVPSDAPRWAVRAALKMMGWFDQVEAVIYGMPDGPEKIAAVEVWEEGNYFVLESTTINGVMQALGKTQEDRDDLFRLAITLKP